MTLKKLARLLLASSVSTLLLVRSHFLARSDWQLNSWYRLKGVVWNLPIFLYHLIQKYKSIEFFVI